MSKRTASCQCGALTAVCEGEPATVSVCHCLDCQKRSGAPFAAQARFPVEHVSFSGESQRWTRRGDEGTLIEFSFCPKCGSTVWFRNDAQPQVVAIAVGAFADPTFAAPHYSVYEDRQYAWLTLVGEDIEHYD